MNNRLYVVRNHSGCLIGAYTNPEHAKAELKLDALCTITEYIKAPAEPVEQCCGNCRWGRETEPGRIQCGAVYSIADVRRLFPDSVLIEFSRSLMHPGHGRNCPKFEARQSTSREVQGT